MAGNREQDEGVVANVKSFRASGPKEARAVTILAPGLSAEPQDRANVPGVRSARVRPVLSYRLDTVRPVPGRPCSQLQPERARPTAEVGE